MFIRSLFLVGCDVISSRLFFWIIAIMFPRWHSAQESASHALSPLFLVCQKRCWGLGKIELQLDGPAQTTFQKCFLPACILEKHLLIQIHDTVLHPTPGEGADRLGPSGEGAKTSTAASPGPLPSSGRHQSRADRLRRRWSRRSRGWGPAPGAAPSQCRPRGPAPTAAAGGPQRSRGGAPPPPPPPLPPADRRPLFFPHPIPQP
mmetsp:Transcript_12163/g.19565  ORF Transcript_12163/g.19565 Transcript_12163/m.19565 type:complete len:204 (+) Transcript_12163:394-1005(+)